MPTSTWCADSRCVVLNFVSTRSGLTVADVEATLGTAVDLALPRSKAAPASVNQGVPLLQSGVRDPMTASCAASWRASRLKLPRSRISKRAARKAQAAALQREAEHRPRRALTSFEDRNRVVA